MDMQGNRRLAVTQQQAWDALNDPQVLQACIPGCEQVTPAGADRYTVVVSVRVGPVAARFNGKISVADVHAPNSYTLSFDGQGGAAGFAKGSARVSLAPPVEGAGCELTYAAQAQVGGRLAQVGQRLVDGVARAMAEDFFKRFDAQMQTLHPQAYVAVADNAETAAGAQSGQEQGKSGQQVWRRVPAWVWVAGAAALLVLAMLPWLR